MTERNFEQIMTLVDEFAEKYRRRSEATVDNYRRKLRYLLRIFRDKGLSADPQTIGEREVNVILDMDLSDNTKMTYTAILKSFCQAMSDKNNRNTNFQSMDLKFDVVIKNRKTLEHEDYLKMLELADDPSIRIALVLGAELGLRRREICNLNVRDIDGQWITIVRGKGGKTARLPISDELMRELKEYLDIRKDLVEKYKDDAGGRLVIRDLGKLRKLSPGAFYSHVRKLSKEVGAETSPHSLRSMYITNKLDSGVPIQMAMKLARHNDANMTHRYYRPRDDLMMKAQNVKVNRSDPMENARIMHGGFNDVFK
ncbi:MAG: site-specific integrase [Methanomassiliicoccaceae archaeon]|nr:site-specific integrase [Methanomassiliicoccaceae archaeon]